MKPKERLGCSSANMAEVRDAGFRGKKLMTNADEDENLAPLMRTGLSVHNGISSQQTSSIKRLRLVDFEAELPRHPTGKLSERRLKDRYWGK